MGVAVRLCALAMAAQSSDRVTTLRAILTASIGLMSLACAAGAMAASMLTTTVATATAWLRHTASLSIRAISFISIVLYVDSDIGHLVSKALCMASKAVAHGFGDIALGLVIIALVFKSGCKDNTFLLINSCFRRFFHNAT